MLYHSPINRYLCYDTSPRFSIFKKKVDEVRSQWQVGLDTKYRIRVTLKLLIISGQQWFLLFGSIIVQSQISIVFMNRNENQSSSSKRNENQSSDPNVIQSKSVIRSKKSMTITRKNPIVSQFITLKQLIREI